jgi:hypothetical protein
MQKSSDQAVDIVTLLASAVHTQETDAVGSTVDIGDAKKMLVLLDITSSATDAGDTLDVYIDVSFDESTWLNAVHFTQQAGNGAAAKEVALLNAEYATDPDAVLAVTADAAAGVVRQQLLAPFVRVRSTVARVTGTDESHTFSVKAIVW